MLRELAYGEIERVEQFLSLPHLSLLIRAVIRGNSPARVWVDTEVRPRVAFLWDGRHCIYLTGDTESATRRELFRWFLAEIGQAAKDARISGFKVYVTDPEWERAVQETLPAMRKRQRILLGVGPNGRNRQTPSLDEFQVQSIDRTLVKSRDVQNLDLVLDEIRGGWPSLDRFLAHGFGIVVRRDDTIACWCTAEYVSEGQCGIGIETVPTFQNRGLATLAATAFVAECAKRQVTAYWDSWQDNHASLRVAEKVGFEALYRYQVHFGSELWSQF